jgi:hypothetical protein
MAYNDRDIDEFILDPYEYHLASVVMALSQVQDGLTSILELGAQLSSVKRDKITGDRLDLQTSSLPSWLLGAIWSEDIESAAEDVLSELREVDLQLLELDSSFRTEVNSVKNFDFDELRKSYDGDEFSDREYLDEQNRAEMDDFLRRRDE